MTDLEFLIEKLKSKYGFTEDSAGYKNNEDYNNGNFAWRNWKIPDVNYKLRDTFLYYNKERNFTHFTSINTLFSILNEKHIRLYNLPNMDDKYEIEYAKNELLFKGGIEKEKEKLYCLSMCSLADISDETTEHLLWKLYGRNGYGVSINLNFKDNVDLWYDYYLAKMSYDPNDLIDVKQFHKMVDNQYLDPLIACFLKLPIYSFEKEIRLIFNSHNTSTISRHNQQIYPLYISDKLHKPDNISYIQIPLLNFFDSDDSIFRPLDMNDGFGDFQDEKYEIPKMEISEIVLGYRYSNDDIKNIQNKMDFEGLGIKVSLSKLKKYF